MAENSAIEWTDHTFNPWLGCTKVSPGCDHCYAEGWGRRSGLVRWGAGEPRRRTSNAYWSQPYKWNAQAEAQGRRFRVFCASLADTFDNSVPAEWRCELLRVISATQNLDWLLLTKRIGNAQAMLEEAAASFGMTWGPHWRNVWIGATIVSQEEADRDIPTLLAVPARLRFLSCEPLLGPVKLNEWLLAEHGRRHIGAQPGIAWVIVGGESGHSARPMHPDWACSLRDQCAAAGVPFVFKQWGEWLPWTQFSHARLEHPPVQTVHWSHGQWLDVGRVGKKAAGRLLDGVEHNESPKELE